MKKVLSLLSMVVVVGGLVAAYQLIFKNADTRKSADSSAVSVYWIDGGDTKREVVATANSEKTLTLAINSLTNELDNVSIWFAVDETKAEIMTVSPVASSFNTINANAIDSRDGKSRVKLSLSHNPTATSPRPKGIIPVANVKFKVKALPASVQFLDSDVQLYVYGVQTALTRVLENVSFVDTVAGANPAGSMEFVGPGSVQLGSDGKVEVMLKGKVPAEKRIGSITVTAEIVGSGEFDAGMVAANAIDPNFSNPSIGRISAKKITLNGNTNQNVSSNSALPSGTFNFAKLKISGLTTPGNFKIKFSDPSITTYYGSGFASFGAASLATNEITVAYVATIAPIENGCSEENSKECDGDSSYKSCKNGQWGVSIACSTGEKCSQGVCSAAAPVPIAVGEVCGTSEPFSGVFAGKSCVAGASCTTGSDGWRCRVASLGGGVTTAPGPSGYGVKFRVSLAGLGDYTEAPACLGNLTVNVSMQAENNVEKVFSNVPLTKVDKVCRASGTAGNCLSYLAVFEGNLFIEGGSGSYNKASFLIKGPRHLQSKYGKNLQDEYYNEKDGEITVTNGAVLNFSKYPLLPGDVNNDGLVDGRDYSQVAGSLLKEVAGNDLDYSCGAVSVRDLNLLKLTLNERQSQKY